MPYQMNGKTRLVGCGVMFLLLIALPSAYFAGGPYTEAIPRPFQSKSWIAAVGNSVDDRRCAMLADLRLRVGIVGRTRDDVVALLGEPEDRHRETSTSYWLLCPSFMDIWVLGDRWKGNRAVEVMVHDT